MSETAALGAGDAQARWLGVRRHQAVLSMIGLALVGDWIIRTRAPWLQVTVGVTLITGAVPMYDGLTIGEFMLVAVHFLGHSRWTSVTVTAERRSLTVRARGAAVIQGYELAHRGRLDLSGHDIQAAHDLASFADALATSDQSRHVSLHVHSTGDRARTLLSLHEGATPPDGWNARNELVAVVAGLTPASPSLWLLERWRYVRSPLHVMRVVRICDFTAAPDARALLERLQQSADHVTVALHFDVVAGLRAHRVAARAVHRLGSDAAASHAIGFRRTARADQSLERLRQRETLVSSGKALLRLAVYVTVWATTYDELSESVAGVVRAAHDSGLRCERGVGRQARWYSNQLPGGPGW